ncbi:polysaccharide deacetylase family protein [Microbacterium sp. RU33B]|uniref:polysaccharide deacetylase family protein n=1 Tax=Microbacterium sp. RU33B TaxID=1907390 RepID=UPI00095BFED0|nr:polysaccharide deacetylase family protein [Microbacterium sp. RU33B]SIT66516.1 Peptidoglycan/xylan/chitin deacetylase, PgdA/CDA1 family [Microbacterium sp. RU33B]
MRRRVALASVMIGVLVLSGCAPAADPAWRTPAWSPSAVLETVLPEPVDPAGVSGLVGHRLRNDDVGVQARFALLPGHGPVVDAFNEAVAAFVRGTIDARARAVAIGYTPHAHAPGSGLNARGCVPGSTSRSGLELLADPAIGPAGGAGALVVCDIVAASGSFLGERVRAVTGGPDGVTSDSSSTLYVDTATGEVVDATALWMPDAARAIAADVIEELRRRAGSLSLAPAAEDEGAIALVQAALAGSVPSPEGMIVTLAPGFTAEVLVGLGVAPTAAPMPIAVRPGSADQLLTDTGVRLLAASGQQYSGPARGGAGFDRTDCTLLPCVALTYDDGPSRLTPGILDALQAHGAAATFFVQGKNMRSYADVARRAVAEGNLVENHSWNHPNLSTLTGVEVSRQLGDTNAAILEATGAQATAFRPPYGEYSAAVLAAAGMPAILWDVDVRDWAGLSDGDLIAQAVAQPRPGSIVLQHDVHENTARTVGAVYEGLQDRGFSLVTVPQLFTGGFPSSGAWRSAR